MSQSAPVPTATNLRVPPPLRRQRRFIGWFSSDTLTQVGGSLTAMALPLLVVASLGSAAQAGPVVAASSVGVTLGMLPGGLLADFRNRRVVVVVFSSVSAALQLVLCALVLMARPGPLLFAAVLALIGICSALTAPAFTATLKRIVDPRQFGMAATAAEGRSAVIALAVPPLGGFLFAISPVLPFFVTAGVVLGGGWLFLTTGSSARPTALRSGEDAPEQNQRTISALLAGLSYLWHNAILRTLLITGMIANLAGSAVLAAVVFELNRRGVSAVTIGLMSTCVAVGALTGAAISAILIERVRSGRVIVVGLLWMATCLIAAGIMATPMAIVILLGTSMIAAPAINAVVGGYTIAVVPADLQGRTDAASTLLSSLAMPLAPVIGGIGVELFSFASTAMVCAGLIVFSTVPCLTSRGVRSMSTASTWAGPRSPTAKESPSGA